MVVRALQITAQWLRRESVGPSTPRIPMPPESSSRSNAANGACRPGLLCACFWFCLFAPLMAGLARAQSTANPLARLFVQERAHSVPLWQAVETSRSSAGLVGLPEVGVAPIAPDAIGRSQLAAYQTPGEALPLPMVPPEGPPLPLGPPAIFRVPLSPEEIRERVSVVDQDGRVGLIAREAPLADVLNVLIENRGINLVVAPDANPSISVHLPSLTFDEAFNAAVRSANCAWTLRENVIYVTQVRPQVRPDPASQERQVRVFRLNFTTATEVEKVVKGLLSPVGQCFPSQTSPIDAHVAQETIVVEDLPAYLARIEQCVSALDKAPRQVLVEVHILQVSLETDSKCGVNFQALADSVGAKITIRTVGFANQVANQAMLINVDSDSYKQIMELVLTTTDAKILSSPKISAVNGQEANLQIGSKLGYFVASTSVGTTIQSVNFLDVGVVLKVTPFITDDGRILMSVSPKVSSGQVSDTGLPSEKTTQLATTASCSTMNMA